MRRIIHRLDEFANRQAAVRGWGLRHILKALLVPVLVGLAGAAMAQTAPASRLFGLVAGPLPQPKPFVLRSRRAPSADYPNINAVPKRRGDRILTEEERKALAASLKAAAARRR